MFVGWMQKSDKDQILDIENSSFDHPWSENDFYEVVRENPDVRGIVVADDPSVLSDVFGFALFIEKEATTLIVNLAVRKTNRRQGVAKGLVNFIKARGAIKGTEVIEVVVSDKNLAAQLFLKSQKFVATHIEEDYFQEPKTDGFIFEHYL